MPSWHAYARQPKLASGTEILITGGHMAVSVLAGDEVTIDMPGDQRLTAVVADCTAEQLTLALNDGTSVSLHPASDSGFAGFQLSEGFSRQSWTVD